MSIQCAHTEHPFDALFGFTPLHLYTVMIHNCAISVTHREMGSLLILLPLQVSISRHFKDLTQHPEFHKAAL